MKINSLVVVAASLLSSSGTNAFTMVSPPRSAATVVTTNTQLAMFGGGGAGATMEDDPESEKQIEAAAKAMNMSVPEYKLGVRARAKLAEEFDKGRVSAGDKVAVTRDINNPPKMMEISITEDAKAQGQDVVSKDLCDALKKASDASRLKRQEAQKTMMKFIQEEADRMGIK